MELIGIKWNYNELYGMFHECPCSVPLHRQEFWGTTIMETHIYIYTLHTIFYRDIGSPGRIPQTIAKLVNITSWNLWF